MDHLMVGQQWWEPPGQGDVPADQRRAYFVTVPDYYQACAFRDWFAREHGAPPSEYDLLGELRDLVAHEVFTLEGVTSDDVIEAIMQALAVMQGAERPEDDRFEWLVDRAKRAASRKSANYREMLVATQAVDELRQVELVRHFVGDFRGLVYAKGHPKEGEAATPQTETAEDGRKRLTRADISLVPEIDLMMIARRIHSSISPTEAAAKNFASRSSGPTSETSSTTAASSQKATPPKATTVGRSKRTASKKK